MLELVEDLHRKGAGIGIKDPFQRNSDQTLGSLRTRLLG